MAIDLAVYRGIKIRDTLKDLWNFSFSIVLVAQSSVKLVLASWRCSQVLKRMQPKAN